MNAIIIDDEVYVVERGSCATCAIAEGCRKCQLMICLVTALLDKTTHESHLAHLGHMYELKTSK